MDKNDSFNSDGLLILAPSLRATRAENGKIGLTEKFIDGVNEFVNRWHGPVRVIIEPSKEISHNLDNVWVDVGALDFELHIVDFTTPEFVKSIKGASVLLGGLSHRQNHIAKKCEENDVACVYTSEYTLKTRLQIVNSSKKSKLQKLKSIIWEVRQEWRQREALRFSRGVQANGMPTFNSYKNLTKNPLLFFDTRTSIDQIVKMENLANRLDYFQRDQSIRLAYSGRLASMKGVSDLPIVAEKLRNMGCSFQAYNSRRWRFEIVA